MYKRQRVSRQQIISVDLASTDNAASTATDFAGFIDYTLGYYYHLPTVLPDLKLLAGGAVHGMGGFIYNTRNGNNPASAKADIDLNISAMAIYKLRVKEYPMTLRYQFTIPFAGVLFSPHYGQSYYEIFNLGNASGVVQFNSFHNKFAMKNFFTVDFPVCNFTIRAGYLNSSYRTDVNGIQSHIISHSFMIGLDVYKRQGVSLAVFLFQHGKPIDSIVDDMFQFIVDLGDLFQGLGDELVTLVGVEL